MTDPVICPECGAEMNRKRVEESDVIVEWCSECGWEDAR